MLNDKWNVISSNKRTWGMKAYEIISRNKILEIIVFNRFVNYEISFTSRHIHIPTWKIYKYSKFCKEDIFDFGKVGSSLPLNRSRDTMSLSPFKVHSQGLSYKFTSLCLSMPFWSMDLWRLFQLRLVQIDIALCLWN